MTGLCLSVEREGIGMAIEERSYALGESQTASAAILEHYVTSSLAVRVQHGRHLGLKYGERPDECIDIFTPSDKGKAPFVAFYHGGWWKANNRVSRAFLATEYLKRGYGFVSIGYPLAPEHTIQTITESAQNALSWLYRNAGSYGLDNDRIVLAGNSAGGHLATMVGAESSLQKAGVPASSILGIASLSGLYDLSPLVGTFVEEWLQLDQAAVKSCSPIHHVPPKNTPVFIAAGETEPDGFAEQMDRYAEVLREAGRSVDVEQASGHSHFSIIGELGRPGARPYEFSIARF